MDEYLSVISKYDQLCAERNNNSYWAENITDATEGISSQIVWQNFYAYLANDEHVWSDIWKESLGEQVEKGLKLEEGKIKFDTKTVHNGCVTTIRMTPQKNLNASNKNGKQVATIFKGIQEEKSDT